MKMLKIKWQRLVTRGRTCERCSDTGREVERAATLLKKSLLPLGIKVVLEKKALSLAAFRKEPARSNRIWVGGRPLEGWLGAAIGHSECCDVCGEAECRTVEAEGRVYESIPAELVIRAGLLAAAGMTGAGAAGEEEGEAVIRPRGAEVNENKSLLFSIRSIFDTDGFQIKNLSMSLLGLLAELCQTC